MKTLSELLKEQITGITDDKLNLTEANDEESRVILKVTKDVKAKVQRKLKAVKAKWYDKDTMGILFQEQQPIQGYDLGILIVLEREKNSDYFSVKDEYVGAFSHKLYTDGAKSVNLLGTFQQY